jgi:phospholipase C
MAKLDQINTIVIVMMENRSFDHVLGYLRMPEYGNRKDIEGLDEPTDNPKYANFLDAQAYQPFEFKDEQFLHDLPHGRNAVATQLAESAGVPTMSGFVQAYKDFTGSVVNASPPMGFLAPKDVPISNFFAEQYMVCDHWFSPLPTDTQPNRSVAFSGYSLIEDTKARPIPVPPGSFVFEWLEKRNIRWRVYHSGLSFFMLFERFDKVLGPNFCSIRDLPVDVDSEPINEMPQVIFIEPEYSDSPVHFGFTVNDNHPPTPIGPGEHFLRDVYATLTKNPKKWKQTLMIVTYDEHGGFFDHVAPLPIATPVPPKALFKSGFMSTGPRVPAFIISPLISAGSVFNGAMDHTSILQLLAEKFDPGNDYNNEVKRRRELGIKSVSEALKKGPSKPRTKVPVAPAHKIETAMLSPAVMPITPGNPEAFAVAGRKLLKQDRSRAIKTFPELLHLPPKID